MNERIWICNFAENLKISTIHKDKYIFAQHDIKLEISTYKMLQKLSITLTEKTLLRELFAKTKISKVKDQNAPNGQLI